MSISPTPELLRTRTFDSCLSPYKVDHNKMEDGAGEEEIGKGPFRWDALKLSLVLWVDLDPQAN